MPNPDQHLSLAELPSRSLDAVHSMMEGADEVDPVAAAFLARSERTMREQPGLVRPMSALEFALAERLVAGVEVDLDRDRLPDVFQLP